MGIAEGHENLGAISPQVFVSVFLGWVAMYWAVMISTDPCATFFGSDKCTPVEMWMQRWVTVMLGLDVAMYGTMAYLAWDNDDLLRRLGGFCDLWVAAIAGQVLTMGHKEAGGAFVKPQFVGALVGVTVMLFLAGARNRGGPQAKALRSPMKPGQFASQTAMFINVFMLFFYFFDVQLSPIDKYVEASDAARTPVFWSIFRVFVLQIMGAILVGMYSLQYTPSVHLRSLLVVGVISQVVFACVDWYPPQHKLIPEGAIVQNTIIHIVMFVVLTFGIVSPNQGPKQEGSVNYSSYGVPLTNYA